LRSIEEQEVKGAVVIGSKSDKNKYAQFLACRGAA